MTRMHFLCKFRDSFHLIRYFYMLHTCTVSVIYISNLREIHITILVAFLQNIYTLITITICVKVSTTVLRTLRKAGLRQQLLVSFYRCTMESIITNCISVWYISCKAADRKALQRVISRAQKIIGTQLPALEDVYNSRCQKKAVNICKDVTHPHHHLFEPLPSGRRYRAFSARTSRLRNSFIPRAIAALNQSSKGTMAAYLPPPP